MNLLVMVVVDLSLLMSQLMVEQETLERERELQVLPVKFAAGVAVHSMLHRSLKQLLLQ